VMWHRVATYLPLAIPTTIISYISDGPNDETKMHLLRGKFCMFGVPVLQWQCSAPWNISTHFPRTIHLLFWTIP